MERLFVSHILHRLMHCLNNSRNQGLGHIPNPQTNDGLVWIRLRVSLNLFPNRVNSEFVQIMDRSHIRMRVWERGSNETWACGTGATASVVACILLGYTDDTVEVALRGGNLTIHWDREKNRAYMTGEAVEVFWGEILLDNPIEILYK